MLKTPFDRLRVNGLLRTCLSKHGKWLSATGSEVEVFSAKFQEKFVIPGQTGIRSFLTRITYTPACRNASLKESQQCKPALRRAGTGTTICAAS